MDMLINNDLRVTEDSLNFILFKRTKSDPTHHFSKGESTEKWKFVGYYSKVERLVNALSEQPISEQERLLSKQLIEHVQRIHQELVSILTPLIQEPFSAISIGENYKFTKDSSNYILSQKKESNATHHFSNGIVKESWKVCGYFGKIEHLAFALIERMIKKISVTTFTEFVLAVSALPEQLAVRVTNNLSKNETNKF